MAAFFKSPRSSAKNLFLFPIFLIIYSFTGNVSNDIYMPSMPLLVNIFSTDQYWIQLTLTLWFLGTAMPQLILGPVADRYGRRPLLFIGGCIFLLATLICGMANHVGALVIARFFQGAGVCSLTIVSFAVVRELFQDRQCIRLLTLINICNSIAPLAGPLLGGYIFLLFGWRANFYVVFIIALVGLIGLGCFMPESKIKLDSTALKPKILLGNYKTLLKNRFFMVHLLAYGLFFGGIITYLTGAPFILINKLKIPPQFFGFTQLAIFSAYFLSAIFVERLVEHYSCKKIIYLGAILIVLATGLMLVAGYLFPENLYTFVGTMMLYALGFGFSSSPLAKETLSAAKTAGGSAAAMLGFSMTGFGSLGSLIVSMTYNGSILSIAAIMCLLAFLGLVSLSYKKNYCLNFGAEN